MEKGKGFFENMMTHTSLTADSLPGQPIVEITGRKRVLIECHRGVLAYSRECIQVAVGYGIVRICGCGLEMIHMSKEKLIIYGSIESVHLLRRG